MRLLALDTSAAVVSAALFENGSLKAAKSEHAPLRANEALAPLVQALLEGGAKVDAVAVCLGPGSFSGLRSGLGFAKAYAYACGAKLLGISALEAWASTRSGNLEVWLDARKGRVYRGRAGKEPDLVEAAKAREEAGGAPVLGDMEGLQGLPQGATLAEAVGKLALKRLERGGSDEPALLAPLYLQRPAPEILWEQRGGK